MRDRLRRPGSWALFLAFAYAAVQAAGGRWRRSPEQERAAAAAASREGILRSIAFRESQLGRDDEAVTRARLASFRAAHRGPDAAAEGKRHRENAERLRETNLHELDRLRARLYEVEAELRGFGR